MVISLVISRHTPADCPKYNEKNRKATLEFASNANELMTKHGVKSLGGWTVHPEHLIVQVLEGPSYEALQAFSQEPTVMQSLDFQTSEIKTATPILQTYERLMKIQQAKQT
jgi:hypothetical protein